MKKPRLTDKVKQGLWLIVCRSATVWSAEQGGISLGKQEREMVLAASRYAAAHWGKATMGNEHVEEDQP